MLRLRRVRWRHAEPTALAKHAPISSLDTRHLVRLIVELVAANAQSPAAVRYFLTQQQGFQEAAAALSLSELSPLDEVALARSTAALVRFSRHHMDAPTEAFWSAYCNRLGSRLGDGIEWRLRLRDDVPGFGARSPEAWLFRHHCARHFLDGLEARSVRPRAPADQIVAFLAVGSCALAAYSYYTQTQVAMRTGATDPFRQIARGEQLAAEIRRWADADRTRIFLGAAATDSKRVPTTFAAVYRAMANLYLSAAANAGPRERRALLRHAQVNIRAAYELLVADRPPWPHGVANTFVSAAACRFLEGNIPGAHAYLVRAVEAYAHTADRHRMMTCKTAAGQLQTSADSIPWTMLLFAA